MSEWTEAKLHLDASQYNVSVNVQSSGDLDFRCDFSQICWILFTCPSEKQPRDIKVQ